MPCDICEKKPGFIIMQACVFRRIVFRKPSLLPIAFMSPGINTHIYRGAGKSLARPTSRCILFDGENISFDALLVIYINSTNIPPIIIINRCVG